jgi:hypothetical protein
MRIQTGPLSPGPPAADTEKSLSADVHDGGRHRSDMSNAAVAALRPRSGFGSPGLRESTPLILGSAALFVAGVVSWWVGVRVGPPRFPLWALLVVLGFVMAIGAVLSWFLSEGESVPVPDDGQAAALPPDSSRRDGELGRPVPDVRRTGHRPTLSSVAPPWDEGEIEAPHPKPSGPPLPRPWSDADAEVAFQELEGIQREIASRRKPMSREE